ncbi:MAG: IS1 family transposase [Plesiomonas shigelloides]
MSGDTDYAYHFTRLGRRTIGFSKSEKTYDKVSGCYLAINHYH